MKRGSLWICIVTSIGLGLSPVGCTNNSGDPLETPHPTLVEVDPEVFLKDVPCGTEPGALQTYVATLFDMTALGAGGAAADGHEYFELPSSEPVPCSRAVAFTLVVPGHEYAAKIQGYARSRDELEQPESGVPILVIPGTTTVVPPDWTAECGDPAPPEADAGASAAAGRVVSQYQETRTVQACTDLVRLGRETPTSVVVGLDVATCDELEPDIATFTVRRDGAPIGSANCGETIELEQPDVEAGQFVELELLAYSADAAAPAFGAVCTAKVLSGVQVVATCGEFGEKGAIRVNVPDVLGSLGTSCSDPVDVVLSIPGTSVAPIQLTRESCRGIARFADLPPGSYSIRAESVRLSRSSTCVATVEPGLSAVAVCPATP